MSPYPPQHVGDTAGLARLASQIEALRGELVPRLERIEEQSDRIERHVEKTNGRVTALELHEAHEAGVAEARDGQRTERRRHDERRWQIRMAIFGAALGLATALTTAAILAYLTPIFPH